MHYFPNGLKNICKCLLTEFGSGQAEQRTVEAGPLLERQPTPETSDGEPPVSAAGGLADNDLTSFGSFGEAACVLAGEGGGDDAGEEFTKSSAGVGAYALPLMVEGVVLDIELIKVVIVCCASGVCIYRLFSG